MSAYLEDRLHRLEQRHADIEAKVVTAVRETEDRLIEHMKRLVEDIQSLRDFVSERIPNPKKRRK